MIFLHLTPSKQLLTPACFIVITAIILVLLTIQNIQAAPITFNTALPVAKGEYLLREQIVLNQSDDDTTLKRDRQAVSSVTTLVYGSSRKLSLFAVIPYVDKRLELVTNGQQVERDNRGFADLTIFARYIFHQRDQMGKTFRMGVFAGVKMPTAQDSTSDGLGILPSSLQLGSGSWDGFAGLVVTKQTLQYQFDGQIKYRYNGEHNTIENGNVFSLDGSWQYRLWPANLANNPTGFLYSVVEVNLISQEKTTISGINNSNTGGEQLFIAPGLQYVTRRWILESAIQIPVVQNLNGNGLENKYIFRAGMRFNF